MKSIHNESIPWYFLPSLVNPHVKIQFEINSQHDEKEFINRFNLSIIIAKKLCNYLQKNNKVVDMTESYDPQSGWSGFNFIIGDQDLSVNGFCFSPERVDSFLIKNRSPW